MRIRNLYNEDPDHNFSELLLKIGNEDVPETNGDITLPEELGNKVHTLHDLISAVYPDIGNLPTKPLDWFCERAILAPVNEAVDNINNKILSLFSAEEKTYISIGRQFSC